MSTPEKFENAKICFKFFIVYMISV